MSRLALALGTAAEALEQLGAAWAVVGGLAVSARTEPRFTRDIDVAVSVGLDREAEALVHSLVRRGYRVLATLEQEREGRLATVRLLSPGEDEPAVVLDLLFASSGIEAELVGAAEVLEVMPGLRVPVGRAGHLLALKLLSHDDHRPQDVVDIHALIREADAADLTLAREAVLLITERGFHRDRNLEAALDGFISRLRR